MLTYSDLPKSDKRIIQELLNLCKTIINHDKSISRIFDGLSGSRFVITVAGLFADDILKEDDLKGLTPDTFEFMLQYKHIMDE